jgi:hypothetical protein
VRNSKNGLEQQRDWWLSPAGVHERFLARGGDFLVLLHNIRRGGLVEWSFFSEDLKTLQLLRQVAAAPVDVQLTIARFTKPSLEESITALFAAIACGGQWDEAAFKEIQCFCE